MPTTNPKLSNQPRQSPGPTSQHLAQKLLNRANSPETASNIFTDKIAHKPLLLNPTSTPQTDARAARHNIRIRKKAYALRKQRPKPLSAREKRELGVYDLKPEECRYDIYQGLNCLWTRYILEVLGYLKDGKVVKERVGMPANSNGSGSLLASADFHGMEVEVVRCRDVGKVGVKGIVVRETRGAFVLVLNEREDPRRKGRRSKAMGNGEGRDKIRLILKKGAVFRVVVDLPNVEQIVAQGENEELAEKTRQLVFDLHGDQLEIRPIERAVKKFKWKATDYL